MDGVINNSNNKFDMILLNALKIPGVKVDSNRFLYDSLSHHIK